LRRTGSDCVTAGLTLCAPLGCQESGVDKGPLLVVVDSSVEAFLVAFAHDRQWLREAVSVG
jgi:hypothetical protein